MSAHDLLEKALLEGSNMSPAQSISSDKEIGKGSSESSQSIVDELFKDFISSKIKKSKKHTTVNKDISKSKPANVDEISKLLDLEISSIKAQTKEPVDSESQPELVSNENNSQDKEKSALPNLPVDQTSTSNFTADIPLPPLDPVKSVPIKDSKSTNNQIIGGTPSLTAVSDSSSISKSFVLNPVSSVLTNSTDTLIAVKPVGPLVKKLNIPKQLGCKLSTESLSLIKSKEKIDRNGRVWEDGEVQSSHSEGSNKAESESDPSETGSINSDKDDWISHSKHKKKHKHKHKKKKKKKSGKEKEKLKDDERNESDSKRDRDSKHKKEKEELPSRSSSKDGRSGDKDRKGDEKKRSSDKDRKSDEKLKENANCDKGDEKEKLKNKGSDSESSRRDSKHSGKDKSDSKKKEKEKKRKRDRSRSRSRTPKRSRRSRSKSPRKSSPKRSRSPRKSSPKRSKSPRKSSPKRSRSPRKSSPKRSRSPRKSSPKRSRSRSPRKSSPRRSRYGEWDARSYSGNSRKLSRSRSRSSSRGRSSKRPRSSDRNREVSKDGDRDLRLQIDKAKLRKIAIANALNSMKSGQSVPVQLDVAAAKSGGKSVEELTDFCKRISEREQEKLDNAVSDSSEEEAVPQSDEEEPLIHHPFKVKDTSTSNIVMNIRNAKQLPVLTPSEKQAQQATLRLAYPVSSGSHHRANESEWVPVEKTTAPATTPTASKAVESQATIDSKPEQTNSIFPSAPQNMDIGSIITERLQAVRKLQANPYDVQALSSMHKAQQKASQWAMSKHLPGQFVGSTGAQVMSQEEILGDKRRQAWVKKTQFSSATPVTGGIGMFLLQKMGWKQGEGLGKNHEGNTEPLKLDIKIDRKGLSTAADNPKARPQVPRVQHAKDLSHKHPVSALMELCNKRRWGPPSFTVVGEDGPDHKKCFLFKVKVNNVEYQPAVPSSNKKSAKAQCAAVCLQEMGLLPRDASVNY